MLAALVLCACAASAAPLEWPADKVNASCDAVGRTARGKGSQAVGLRVFVVKGAKGDAQRLAIQLMTANYVFNALKADGSGVPAEDPASEPCGVKFEFRGPAQELDLPKAYLDPVDYIRDRATAGQAYYGNPSGLSPAEFALLEQLGKAGGGEVNVVYIPGLGGGRGYTYQTHLLRGALERMEPAALPKGKKLDDLVQAYKNTILLSDTANIRTLAHELGHALTGRGHIGCSRDEERADPQGCAETKDNLMTAEGFGMLLDDSQCRMIGRRLRGGHMNRR